ncbi:PaaI family thioesterase [Halorubrum halophilum]|uniref:PaaI family thioesterase n=1 Tax=Halorubrum halophilum TaxID=413816 RepID=UPI000678D811|nr:hotdog fold thioesterase [Halorubrum halophilum]
MSDVPTDLREQINSDPFCELLDIAFVDIDVGTAQAELTVTDELLNFHGTLHGGAIYSLADAAFAAASNSHGDAAVGLESNISYLAAVDVGETLLATAEETHLTDGTGEYEVTVTNGDGDQVATFRGRVYRP